MKNLSALLLVVAAAVGLAMVLEQSWGTLTLWWPPYRIDMSLQAALLGLLLAIAISLLLGQLLAAVLGLPARVRRFRRRRRQAMRLQTLSDLVVDFLEGRFARAVKAARGMRDDREFMQDVPAASAAVIAIGASAAHRLRDTRLRDAWVEDLAAESGQHRIRSRGLAALLEAEFALDDRQGRRALSALAPLTAGARRHVHTLRLALRAHQQAGDWDEVLRLTRLLENRKAIATHLALTLKRQVAAAWIDLSRHEEAAALVADTLRKEWDPGLAMLYGRCLGQPREQLAQLELWLARHPQDPELNWALGRVCQRQRLWGKARMHLEASLRIKPMVPTHLALAEIAESLAEKETAALHWKAAAQMVR
jgi:HemY protein